MVTKTERFYWLKTYRMLIGQIKKKGKATAWRGHRMSQKGKKNLTFVLGSAAPILLLLR